MSLLLFLSIGCSNLDAPGWQGSGARYASGYASDPSDTGGGGDDTGGGGDGSAPELTTGAAAYEANDLGQLYIQAGVAYEDVPDDVLGGRLYYSLLGDGDELEQGARDCTDDEEAELTSKAIVANGIVSFSVGPVDEGVSHSLVVYLNDYTQNSSNEITLEVTGE